MMETSIAMTVQLGWPALTRDHRKLRLIAQLLKDSTMMYLNKINVKFVQLDQNVQEMKLYLYNAIVVNIQQWVLLFAQIALQDISAQ
jgi:hypothetical protein